MKEQILAYVKENRERLLRGGAIACYGLLVAGILWAGCARIRFDQVSPSSGRSAAAVYGASEEDKLTYERLKNGDTMYCSYFGILNVRSAPSSTSELVGQLSYGDQVQAFWKEDSGYVRILAKKAHSDEILEGYCLREELSDAMPSDGRIYLNMVDYKQYDARWGSISLGDSYETVESAGCTTTCLAMAYTYLEGAVTTPDGMVERLYYNEEGMLGFPKVYEKYYDSDYLDVIYQKLTEGVPVLVGGKNDGGGQHWVLVVGYQGGGSSFGTGDFVIHDPASTERPTLTEFFTDYPIFNAIAYYKG